MLNIHQHSEHSKDGLSKVEEIAKAHKDMGTNSFCITDHGSMSAFPTAFTIAKEMDMKFVPGCEIYLAPPKDIDSKYVGVEIAENARLAKLKRIDKDIKATAVARLEELQKVDAKRNFHMTLIAKNQTGLDGLFNIYTEGEQYYNQRVSTESVFKHKEGIIVLSGCLGSELCYYVRTRQIDKAEKLMLRYHEEFGDDYYVEIMHHGVIDTKEDEKGYMTEIETYSKMIELANKHGINLIATNDGHYTHEADFGLHDIYTDIIYDKKADDSDASETQGYHGDGYFIISEPELKERLIGVGHKVSDVENMLSNVHKVESKIEDNIDIRSPKDLKNKEVELTADLMKAWESRRKGTEFEEESLARIKYEMSVIGEKNFTAYFTNMKVIVDRAYDIGLLTGPGRGSAAGSEIAYMLGITKTDPLYYGLLFERFLNPSRSEMPDIDLDIMSKLDGDTRLGSEILTDSLRDKFKFAGRINNTVKGSTLVLFKKLASYYDINFQMANKITTSGAGKLMLDKEEPPTHQDFVNTIHSIIGSYDKKWDTVYQKIGICYRLHNIVFGFSIHASGVIMTEDDMPLPLNSSNVIDFNGDSLEGYQYIKYDLLSIDALNAIYDLYGLDIDWEDVYDPKVWDTIGTGELDFVFQLAGFIPKKMSVDGKPRTIEEIAEISAINRPGPLNMGLNTKWVDIRNNNYTFEGAEVTVAGILKNAFGDKHSGLLIYQEDVMRVFVDGAGFSLPEAENVRKAMGDKDEELMDSFKDKMIKGWQDKGYTDDPEEVWGMLHEFSKYAFNKSHAVSYSQISYMNAKMWTYKRKEYINWLLNNAPKKKQEVLRVAKDNGYILDLPTFRNAQKRDKFEIVDKTIYAPIDTDANFETASEFLFSSMSKIDKCKLIMMGVLDSVTKDRLSMSTMIKSIPDAKLVIPGFPATSNIRVILEQGAIAGLWKYEQNGAVTNVTVFRARSIAEVELYINASDLPAASIERNIKNDLTNFGVPKPGLLSEYPLINKERIFTKFYTVQRRIENKIKDDASNEEVVRLKRALKNEYKEALRHPEIARLQSSLMDEVFTGYLVKANHFRDYGYLLLEAIFDNGTYSFYIRDKQMIEKYQSLSKGKAIRAYLKMDSYMSKHGEPIVLMKIDQILQ